jgi:phage terminase large subunit
MRCSTKNTYARGKAAFVGSYYGSYLLKMPRVKRIGNARPDPGVRVHTAWDLGVSDCAAIWSIQHCGREYRLVDYREGLGVGLDEYVRLLREKAHQRHYGRH